MDLLAETEYHINNSGVISVESSEPKTAVFSLPYNESFISAEGAGPSCFCSYPERPNYALSLERRPFVFLQGTSAFFCGHRTGG